MQWCHIAFTLAPSIQPTYIKKIKTKIPHTDHGTFTPWIAMWSSLPHTGRFIGSLINTISTRVTWVHSAYRSYSKLNVRYMHVPSTSINLCHPMCYSSDSIFTNSYLFVKRKKKPTTNVHKGQQQPSSRPVQCSSVWAVAPSDHAGPARPHRHLLSPLCLTPRLTLLAVADAAPPSHRLISLVAALSRG